MAEYYCLKYIFQCYKPQPFNTKTFILIEMITLAKMSLTLQIFSKFKFAHTIT